MSLVKYRLKEVAADFGVAPKEIAEIISKFFEKPKSNTQVMTEDELNVIFDYMTQHNQIASLEQVFAVQPKEQPKAAPVKEAPKAEAAKPAYFDVLPLSLEEIFIYELGGVNYAVKDILL